MKIANNSRTAAVTTAAIRTDIAAQEWKGPWRRYDMLERRCRRHRPKPSIQLRPPARDVAAALERWDTAGPNRQTAWATTFDTALTNERPMSASWKTARPANLAATISASSNKCGAGVSTSCSSGVGHG